MDGDATVSINDGPEVPLAKFETAADAAGIGHNVGGILADRLRSIVERWERLDEEVKALRSDQKDIMTEAKSAGFDCKVLRQLIRTRKQEPNEVETEGSLLVLYRHALGMLA